MQSPLPSQSTLSHPTHPPTQKLYLLHRASNEDELRSIAPNSEAVASVYRTYVGSQNRDSDPRALGRETSGDLHNATARSISSATYFSAPAASPVPAGSKGYKGLGDTATSVRTDDKSPRGEQRAQTEIDVGAADAKDSSTPSLRASTAKLACNNSFGAHSEGGSEAANQSLTRPYYSNTGNASVSKCTNTKAGAYYYGGPRDATGQTSGAQRNSNHSSGRHTKKKGCLAWVSEFLSNLLPFYLLCSVFGIVRCVMWALSARTSVLINPDVQLTFFIIPSVMYLVMLSLLTTSWYSAFCAVGEFHANHEFGHFRIPILMYAGYLLEFLTLVFFLYCMMATKKMTSDHQSETTGAMGVASLMMGFIIAYIGLKMYGVLNNLPFNFRGLDVLKKRVRRIYVFVAPTLFLRALFSLAQLVHVTPRFDSFIRGCYFVFVFYFAFEIAPLLLILQSLGKSRGGGGGESGQEKTVFSAPQRVMSMPRQIAAEDATRRHHSWASTPLNLTGCKRSLAVCTTPQTPDDGRAITKSSATGISGGKPPAVNPPYVTPPAGKHVQHFLSPPPKHPAPRPVSTAAASSEDGVPAATP